MGVSNPIPGATASKLTLANVTRLDAGHYYVTVSNPARRIDSEQGTLALFTLSYLPSLGARMELYAWLGEIYRFEYADDLGSGDWTPFAAIVAPGGYDDFFVKASMRFYRAVYAP